MTAQISDGFSWDGKEYELIGISGTDLFIPEDHGFEPEMMHTACYRGYYVEYLIDAGKLILRKMTIRNKENLIVKLGGIEPELGAGLDSGNLCYSDLSILIPFTGKLRLARNFIKKHYIHMGFQKPSAYKTVFDLTFEHGVLVETLNRSKEAERIRGQFQERFSERNGIESIEEAFDMDMELK